MIQLLNKGYFKGVICLSWDRISRNKSICTYRAPIGYLNFGEMENKPFDPVRAPIIREIFELYAKGNWSLSDLARHASE